MNLQELLGEAYKENMTIEEVNTALQGKKLADLSTGNYVDVNKYNKEVKDLQDKLNNEMKKAQESSTKATTQNSENQGIINELQEQLKQLTLENNKSSATANVSDAKRLLEIKDDDSEYVGFINNVSALDKDISSSIASYLNKQVKAAYEKGKQDGVKNGLGEMGKQKGSSDKEKSSGNFGKQLAEKYNSNNNTFDYFKRNI